MTNHSQPISPKASHPEKKGDSKMNGKSHGWSNTLDIPDREPAVPGPTMVSYMTCRLCDRPVHEIMVDLGAQPLANSYLTGDKVGEMEPTYPLAPAVCTDCHLVQLPPVVAPESIFRDYAYFSSYSGTILRNAERYAKETIDRLGLGTEDLVLEVASNDGYLLRFFKDQGVPVLGVEPAENVARVAVENGIRTCTEFFEAKTAEKIVADHGRADLIVANNVMAHVPDLHGFLAGFKTALADDGTISIEVPHIRRLIEKNQFDTIYHEHFSYFSLHTARAALARHDLRIHHVDEIAEHGGSLRIWACHKDSRRFESTGTVERILDDEKQNGLLSVQTYQNFGEKVEAHKRALLRFLIDARDAGKTVAAYGAPAKASTLLNFIGARSDLVSYTVDRSPHKQGKYIPGVRVPILPPEAVFEDRPDYLLVLPWNIRHEIVDQMSAIRDWGGKFVIPIPELEIVD